MPEAVGMIQGQTPDSVEEWRVSKALDKYGWDYLYQYPINGGRSLRGGSIPDFLVMTAPQNTALYVQGDYWHGSKQQQEDELEQSFAFGPLQLEVVVITTDKLETQQESDETIAEIFGSNK